MFSNWRNFANDFVARSGDPQSSKEIHRQLLTHLRLFSPIKFLSEYSLFTIKQLSIRLNISLECICWPPTPPTHNYHGCKLSFQLAVEAPEAAIKENPRLWLDTVQVSCSCYRHSATFMTHIQVYSLHLSVIKFVIEYSHSVRVLHAKHFTFRYWAILPAYDKASIWMKDH